ncbi:hypothetical protein ABT173_34495 [Streptomyces sp. NPDC001795]|uniref:hypothetical protein n=1 Tax=unclassified Streptomyces TaxID=2593676 RepID=UPI00332AC0D8
MPADRPATRLSVYARLPRAYRELHIVHSTVDADGRAHWLPTERPPDRRRTHPYDAVVVTVQDGRPHETQLSAVRSSYAVFDALPDGGFVVAAPRSRRDEEHVQVFDALGRCSWTFRLGDGIEDLLVDGVEDIWVGHFDEGIHGDDELSAPGLRRWSSTGEPLWAHTPGPGHDEISDCYALNVGARAVWACPYPHFPLLEIRDGRTVRARENPVKGASAFAVHDGRVVFFSPYGDDHSVLVDCRITWNALEAVAYGRLVRPDGGELGRRRTVCRGPRVHVQEEPFTDWTVLDISPV